MNVVQFSVLRALTHDSARYRFYLHRYGCLEIARPRDRVSVFFQGENAERVRSRIAALERHYGGKLPDVALDRFASNYDHVMSATGA